MKLIKVKFELFYYKYYKYYYKDFYHLSVQLHYSNLVNAE